MNSAKTLDHVLQAEHIPSVAPQLSSPQVKDLLLNMDKLVYERTYQLQKLNGVLEAFSYSVANDLRQPVNEMLDYISEIKKRYLPGFCQDMKDLFKHIESSAIRMSSIIDALLTFAKCRSATMHLVTIDTTTLAAKVWAEILLASPHHAQLDTMPLPAIQGDSLLIEQVFINLLSNAVKYSSKKEKPVISLGYTTEGSKTIFYVKDNGAGFDMQFASKLFCAFQRLHGMSDFEGTGVGLSLVKQIVERHGGKIWANSKVNEGATFYFTLPC